MAPNLFYLLTRISAEWTLATYALNKLYRVKSSVAFLNTR